MGKYKRFKEVVKKFHPEIRDVNVVIERPKVNYQSFSGSTFILGNQNTTLLEIELEFHGYPIFSFNYYMEKFEFYLKLVSDKEEPSRDLIRAVNLKS